MPCLSAELCAASSKRSRRARPFPVFRTRPRAIWGVCPSTWSAVRDRFASNMSHPAPRSCFATTPTRRRARAACSSFTALRRCGAGSANRRPSAAHLQAMPPLFTERLRECQIDAITNLEASLAADHPRALIQMATGAGKTFTACIFSLSAPQARRAPGASCFSSTAPIWSGRRGTSSRPFARPATGRRFTELYNVQRLGPAGLDPVASVVIATIQRALFDVERRAELSERRRGAFAVSRPRRAASRSAPSRYNPAIPIESFDFIITDECHRSIYGSGARCSNTSTPSSIGLTATPSTAHARLLRAATSSMQYPYERSVADGVNVGYEIFRISTDIGEHGGAIVEAATRFRSRDRRTRAERYEELDQDLDLHRAGARPFGHRAEPDPHRPQSLSRQACSPNCFPAAAKCRRP